MPRCDVIGVRQDRAFRRRLRHVAGQHVALLDDLHRGGDGDAFGKGDGVLQRVAARHQLDDVARRGVRRNFDTRPPAALRRR